MRIVNIDRDTSITVTTDKGDFELRGNSWYKWYGDSLEFHSLDSDIQEAFDRYMADPVLYCYECDAEVRYLFDDSRCGNCTHLTPEEVRGH